MSHPMFQLKDFPDREAVFQTEGGTVYTAALGGRFYIIVDESMLSDLLGEEEIGPAGSLVSVREFSTPRERDEYLEHRGWNRRRRPGSVPNE